jgi:copper chaperone CopZ
VKRNAMTGAALAVLAFAVPTRAEQVTLRIEGVHANADGDAIAKALSELPTVKVTTTPTKEKPTAVLTFDMEKTDLGEMANAVAATKTPNRDKGAPAAILVLGYERLDGSAAADEVYLPKKVDAAFAKLKGVEEKQCKLDTKQKQVLIKLDDQGGAKLADIKTGFPGLSLK